MGAVDEDVRADDLRYALESGCFDRGERGCEIAGGVRVFLMWLMERFRHLVPLAPVVSMLPEMGWS